MMRSSSYFFSIVLAIYHPFCTAKVEPTVPGEKAPMAELWQAPDDIGRRDVFNGPWGRDHAPDPKAVYLFVDRKQHGTNPGITVKDETGREWHVKQPPHNDAGAEGPIEVTLSRVLSAVGYYQPPVYFVPSLTVSDGKHRHIEPGGRFRLTDKSIKHLGEWSWQANPFVRTRPYQGLLVMLMMFNSSDLKNENNALYQVREAGTGPQQWYVVRDLGTALGETGRLARRRGDLEFFERTAFITQVKDGFVQFDYHGWHQELFKQVSPADVVWASELLGRLSDEQWHDAFRAGAFEPSKADRFIRRLHEKIAEGLRLRDDPTRRQLLVQNPTTRQP